MTFPVINLHKPFRYLTLLLLLVAGGASVVGQTYTAGRERFMTWDDFVDDYFSEQPAEDDTDARAALIDRLEAFYAFPLNINTATRSELLAIPIMSEAHADSILAYRSRSRLFLSLGELQFVSGLDHTDRCRLSLFVYAGDTVKAPSPAKTILWGGRHELSTRFDLPLYRRSGYKPHTKKEVAANPNAIYLGYAPVSTTRYRYHNGPLSYGVTLQKDAGEPFMANGNYPFDYISAYVAYTPGNRPVHVWLGDYEVRAGNGLLMGRSYFTGLEQSVDAFPLSTIPIRAHTSADESNFLRGAAATWHHHDFSLTAFGSWRQLDARIKNDTAVTLYTTGLHRTPDEIDNRRTLTNLTGGLRASWQKSGLTFGLNAIFDHYSHPIYPPLREYNRYYLRGSQAGGLSADWRLRHRRWTLMGEAAVDLHGHPALSQLFRYDISNGMGLTLGLRHFSPRYVAPHASTLCRSSRNQNETGIIVGFSSRFTAATSLLAYADLFRFSRPTYTAGQGGSKGIVTRIQLKHATSDLVTWTVRHDLSSRQLNITGKAPNMEYVCTQRLRLAATMTPCERWSLHTAVDGSLYARPSRRPSQGIMFSIRTRLQATSTLTTYLFGAIFATDDYASRLYAYEPQMRYAAAFPSYAYHGYRLAALANWKPITTLTLSLRYSILHYFNRRQIASGAQQIDHSSQNDLSLQAIWKF
ncbi:MAG: helix-hairpin-helix domain-containing protein [Alloprevotella sp.]|nr:helix-hairpin-helix domain-containing protein [Alloprevotella sp.]